MAWWWAFALFVLFVILNFAFSKLQESIKNFRFQKFAKAHGAEEPPHTLPSKLPRGIDRLYRVLNSSRSGEDIWDDIVLPQFTALGRNTFVSTDIMGQRVVNTMDPKNVQTILAVNFKDWEIGKRRSAQFGAILGNSILTTDGAEWSHSRGLARPQFTRENINDLEGTEKACQDLIRVINGDTSEGWTAPVDLAPLLYRFTLDTSTKFFFGKSVNSQLAAAGIDEGGSSDDELSKTLNEEFDRAWTKISEWMGMRIRMQGLYWLCNSPKYQRAIKLVRDFANHYVQLALKSHSQVSKSSSEAEPRRFSLLESLAQDSTNATELRDQILSFLFAGRETTAGLLSWTFAELARDAATQAQLRAAIAASFGADPAGITFAALKGCAYLQHVLRETLRLHPVTPMNNRVAARDTVLPAGGGPDGSKPVAVRKGQLCNFMVYGLQRREDIWGPDAAEFRPERWAGRKLDWSYIPFSGGPRICIGQQYALTEAAYLIVRVFQTFPDMEWVGAEGKLRKGSGVTMSPKFGVPVRFSRRKT